MAKRKLSREFEFDDDWGDWDDPEFDINELDPEIPDISDPEFDYEPPEDINQQVDDTFERDDSIENIQDFSGISEEQRQYQLALQSARLSMQAGFGFGQFGSVDFSVEDDDTSFGDLGRDIEAAENKSTLFDSPIEQAYDPKNQAPVDIDFTGFEDVPYAGLGSDEDEDEEYPLFKNPNTVYRNAPFDDLGAMTVIK